MNFCYIHLTNNSCVIKYKVKVKEIIKDHNKLCEDLSKYLESYNLVVVNIEDEYIDYVIDTENEEVE